MNAYRKVRLPVQSGGRVMDDSLDVVQQVESCVQDAGPFCRISFDPFPADHPDEYHDLKVVVDRPGLIARTNTGYYLISRITRLIQFLHPGANRSNNSNSCWPRRAESQTQTWRSNLQNLRSLSG